MLRNTSRVPLAASLRRLFFGLAISLGVGGISADAQAGAPQTIAYAGVLAPGTGGQAFFSAVLPANPIARGNSIIFEHRVGVSNYGIWRWENGTLSKIVFKGDALPGSSEPYSSNYLFSVDDTGMLAFSDTNGLFVETSSGQIAQVFAKDQQAPGYTGKLGPVYNMNYRNGEITFLSPINTTKRAIWRGTAAGFQAAMVESQVLPSGDVIQTIDQFAPMNGINSSVALVTLGPALNDAILRQVGNALPEIVAKVGDPAPGFTANVYSGILNPPLSNNTGQMVYIANMTGGTVSEGLFRDLGNGPQFMIGKNSRVPNSPAGQLASIDYPRINNSGTVTFRGSLFDNSLTGNEGKTGIWKIDVAGNLHEIVRYNMASIIDMPDATFATVSTDYALGNSGQVAWLGSVTGPGINPNNNTGLWATLPNGQHVTVVREGDVIEVTPGINRTVRSVELGTINDTSSAYSSPWTDDGQLVYKLTFSDSTTGIFVSQVIPEPSTISLVVFIVGVLGWQLQKRSQ